MGADHLNESMVAAERTENSIHGRNRATHLRMGHLPAERVSVSVKYGFFRIRRRFRIGLLMSLRFVCPKWQADIDAIVVTGNADASEDDPQALSGSPSRKCQKAPPSLQGLPG